MWRITIGIRHYWLTNEEKEFYLSAIKSEQEFVELPSGKILSKNFMDLVSKKEIERTAKIDDGYGLCKHGKWIFDAENGCMCEEVKKLKVDSVEDIFT